MALTWQRALSPPGPVASCSASHETTGLSCPNGQNTGGNDMTITGKGLVRRRFLLLHNPVAGVRRRTLASRVASELERRGAEIVMLRSWGATAGAAPGAIARDVQLDGFDAVIAAGGDGTVRALATALGESTSIPIGIIPTGTGNVLANEIGMPKKASEIAEVLMNGPVVEVAGAAADREAFFLMAGAGFDGEVVAGLNQNLKRRFGKLAYIVPIMRSLMKKPQPFAVTVDGQELEATWIIAANGRNYAGTFVLAPQARLSVQGFDAIVFNARTRRGRLLELLAIVAGLHARLPGVTVLPCHDMTVMALGVPLQIDGDPMSASPVTITSRGPRLRLIGPREQL